MPKVNKITKNLGKMNLDEPEDQDIKPNLIKIEPENADSVTFNSRITMPRQNRTPQSPSHILDKLGNQYASAIVRQSCLVDLSNRSTTSKEMALNRMERTVQEIQLTIDNARSRMNTQRMAYNRVNEPMRQQQIDDANQYVREQAANNNN